MVLDPIGTEFRSEAKRTLLMGRATALDDVRRWVRSEVGLRGFVPIPGVLSQSHFSNSEIADALLDLQRHKEIVIHEKISASPEQLAGFARPRHSSDRQYTEQESRTRWLQLERSARRAARQIDRCFRGADGGPVFV